MTSIRCGDTVKHGPTGETWLVAYVRDDRLAWCGWPQGEAALSDCTLVEACSDDEHMKRLREIAAMPGRDMRKSMAIDALSKLTPAPAPEAKE